MQILKALKLAWDQAASSTQRAQCLLPILLIKTTIKVEAMLRGSTVVHKTRINTSKITEVTVVKEMEDVVVVEFSASFVASSNKQYRGATFALTPLLADTTQARTQIRD